jgi:hypothetical protein
MNINSIHHFIYFCLDSCDTEKEEEVVDYIANNDLITLGWIHVEFHSFFFCYFEKFLFV